MSVPTQQGGFALAIQNAKSTAGGYVAAVDADFHPYLTLQNTLDIIEDSQTLPQEIGGVALPTGAYKAGYNVAGQVTLVARMVNVGWLLLAACGAQTAGTVASSVYTHKFGFKTANHFDIPRVSIRSWLGGETTPNLYTDCVIVSLQLNLVARGYLVLTLGILGRTAEELSSESVPAPSLDPFGLSCLSHIRVPRADATKKFMAGQITIVNQPSTPDMESVIGSHTMDDIVVLARNVTANLTLKYEDKEFYDDLHFDGTANWSADIFETSLELKVVSPEIVSGSTPYSLEFDTDSDEDNLALTAQPIGREGQSIVVMQVAGSLLHSAAGLPFELTLVNNKSTRYDTGSTIV